MSPGRLGAWFLACRPKTLSVSLAPVLVGTALAWQQQAYLLWLPLLAAALGAALIQIGTNLFNDVGDFLRGADQPGRIGPPRATAEGWLTPTAVRAGAWASFALAFACGIYLVSHGGWPIVVIGLCSLAAGWAYTGGPRPIAYGPLGELFVIAFFGVVAVGGSYYLQTLALSPAAVLAGLQLGLLAAAVITVNNYRDLDSDATSGKRTLAVRLGRPATRWLYAGELLSPYLLLGGTVWPLLSLPLALWLIRRFWREKPGPGFNGLLAATAGLQLAFALLLTLSLTI
ncbi:1,4-dihydroxy-2-naphthoate polyprenyltransferase [uncultured Azonexus sp.]|uniref:1,4-dihydroxy-2-naphthoate polyprenyltransferase n=1 Tax=uncultured Azonexus sp. TaxID=520307 RepID=UPI0026230DE8|nr:1,4-dihydroxy-2-naphthoate polyprenyltransferase [uncultured Azonexus sp.]